MVLVVVVLEISVLVLVGVTMHLVATVVAHSECETSWYYLDDDRYEVP